MARSDKYYEEEDEERELVPVPRRGRGRWFGNEPPEVESYSDDRASNQQKRGAYYDEEEQDRRGPYYDEEEDEDFYDVYVDDDDEDSDDDEEEEYEDDILIPSPLLDNIDPDGAAERFGEIALDPKFLLDVLIFVAVLNFVDYVAHVPVF